MIALLALLMLMLFMPPVNMGKGLAKRVLVLRAFALFRLSLEGSRARDVVGSGSRVL